MTALSESKLSGSFTEDMIGKFVHIKHPYECYMEWYATLPFYKKLYQYFAIKAWRWHKHKGHGRFEITSVTQGYASIRGEK